MQEDIKIENIQNCLPLKFQQFKCPYQNQAYTACCSFQCLQFGLICRKQDCKCFQKHGKCQSSLVKDLINKINEKVLNQQKDKKKKAYEGIIKVLQSMVDKLSQLIKKYKYFQKQSRFEFSQQEFIRSIFLYKKSLINGKTMSKIINDTQIQAQDESKEEENINQLIKTQWNNIKKKVQQTWKSFSNEVLQKIKEVDVNKYITKFISDSQILTEKQKRKKIYKNISNFFGKYKITKSKLISRYLQSNKQKPSINLYFSLFQKKQYILLISQLENGSIFGGLSLINDQIKIKNVTDNPRIFIYSFQDEQCVTFKEKKFIGNHYNIFSKPSILFYESSSFEIIIGSKQNLTKCKFKIKQKDEKVLNFIKNTFKQQTTSQSFQFQLKNFQFYHIYGQ